MEIFVVFGNNPYSFNRLVNYVSLLSDMGHKITVQAGASFDYAVNKLSKCNIFRVISEEDFTRYMTAADIIISHSGFGVVFKSIQMKKPLFCLPRQIVLNESLDNQNEIFDLFENNGLLHIDKIFDFVSEDIPFPYYNHVVSSFGDRSLDNFISSTPILAVSSAGGHGDQIKFILGDVREVTFVSPRKTSSKNQVYVADPHRNIISHIKVLITAFRLISQLKPAVIVSTGAGLCIWFFVVAKCMGISTIYIESYSRRDKISLTLKIIEKFNLANYVFVQSEKLITPLRRFYTGLFS